MAERYSPENSVHQSQTMSHQRHGSVNGDGNPFKNIEMALTEAK